MKVFLGLVLGVMLSIGAYVFFTHNKIETYCGKDQNTAECTQQWLASVGTAAALLIGAAGGILTGRQLQQGQSSVDKNELDHLREQYDIFSELRDDILERQRKIEAFDEIYKSRLDLPSGTDWKALEMLQFEFDGFVEEITDAKREPHLFNYREGLEHFRWRAFIRSETYRCRAEAWDKKTITGKKMATNLMMTKAGFIRDLNTVRSSLDNLITAMGNRVAVITKTPPDTKNGLYRKPKEAKPDRLIRTT